MKKRKSEKNSTNIKAQRKYVLLIGLGFIFLFVILLSTKLNPIKLLGNAYSSTDIESNIDKIKIGDIINYEINGYSNWQVVSIDKNNNTLDVVSRTNVEDVSLTTKEDYENALDIFQATANKYVDGKYAIKARCVSRADLENFGFDEVFWNADIYNGSVAFTDGAVKYGGTDDISTDYSFLPYVRYHFEESISQYNVGDEIDLNLGGIDKWVFVEQPYDWMYSNMIVPATPLSINIVDDEIFDNPSKYFNDYFKELKNSDPNVDITGNYLNEYGYNAILSDGNLKNHFSAISNNFEFIGKTFEVKNYANYIEFGFNSYQINFENNFGDYKWIRYSKSIPYTKGFRPIVTLKYSDKLIEGKEIDSGLQIGDYINYSANEYNNWRVLSIDKENNTVDIISGGVVKNKMLYGKDNYDNYEDIMQSEVDAYKVGDKAISARLVEYNDLPNLNKMNDKVNTKYWTYETKDYNKKAVNDTSSPYATNAFYDASLMYYDINESTIQRKWVSLYISTGLTSGGNSILSVYNGGGDLSFTAGIRPVITLKMDDIQTITDDEMKNIINDDKEKQRAIDNEQKNNSEKYITNDSSKNVKNNYTTINRKNDTKDSKDNDKINDNNDEKDSEINNYYNNSNKKKSTNKIVKYIIIALVVLNIAILGQVVLSVFIINNIKNIKRRKK